MEYSYWFDTLLYCKIITTMDLSDNCTMSRNYLFCVCGENLEADNSETLCWADNHST